MRFFFRAAYNGTNYNGWQRQENGPSVQQALEEAFSVVTRQPCKVLGAGRTDAGVHARRQGAHVDMERAPADLGRCERSVNAVLRWDVAIRGLRPVPDTFDARYSAAQRVYRYYITTVKDPLACKLAWPVYYRVDWEQVRRNAGALVGTHDFAAFCASGSSTDNTVCAVSAATLEYRDPQWVFSISANRFIYRMVRAIVGTLIDIGRGSLADTMNGILESRDRSRAGATAPACGLFLEDVVYPGVDW